MKKRRLRKWHQPDILLVNRLCRKVESHIILPRKLEQNLSWELTQNIPMRLVEVVSG